MTHHTPIRVPMTAAPFHILTKTPLTLASRIGSEPPNLARLKDLVRTARQPGGVFALPAPEATLAAHIFGFETVADWGSTAEMKALIPQAWADLAANHPRLDKLVMGKWIHHDFPREGPQDANTIVVRRTRFNTHHTAQVKFPAPAIHFTFPEHPRSPSCQNWLIAGALAAHFKIDTNAEQFVEDLGNTQHFTLPTHTATTFLRVGAWLGLTPQNQDTTTDAGAPR
jgi:hypothetical protein